MTRTIFSNIVCLNLISLIFASCNESLPTREDVTHLFKTSVSSSFYRTNGQNVVRILMTVKNLSDETIEETAVLNGNMEVTWVPARKEDTPNGVNTKRTFTVSKENIFTAKGYDRTTGKLTMSTNDSIVFYVQWNMKSDDSTFLPNYWQVNSDNQCGVLYSNGVGGSRKISLPQQLNISFNMKMFDKLATLYSIPTVLEQCYVSPYVAETNDSKNPCTDLNVKNPCSIISP